MPAEWVGLQADAQEKKYPTLDDLLADRSQAFEGRRQTLLVSKLEVRRELLRVDADDDGTTAGRGARAWLAGQCRGCASRVGVQGRAVGLTDVYMGPARPPQAKATRFLPLAVADETFFASAAGFARRALRFSRAFSLTWRLASFCEHW